MNGDHPPSLADALRASLMAARSGRQHLDCYVCKTCVPERRFWSEHDLVKHILEVRKAEGKSDEQST